jgi:hypothetical protein
MEAPAFYLHLPPTPVKGRFVMLEESTKTFYDVDTVTPLLGNPASWAITGLSPSILGANRLAIVVPNHLNAEWRATLVKQGPMPDGQPYNPDFEVARLVSITGRTDKIIHAKVLGKVNICPFKSDLMSFDKIKVMKGSVLPDEMRNGLLGKLYGGLNPGKPFVHPEVLDKMPRKWHVDAAALNYELDGIFASGLEVKQGSVKWLLS